MAIVAMAPGMFFAHRVVPSSGSTAMSTFGPCLLPTVSPMNSIGASSISPSPITTVPSIGSLLSSRRMASTAAWSAAFSSPRPRSRAALTAARSVTRTISSARMRSSIRLCGIVIDAISFSPQFQVLVGQVEHDLFRKPVATFRDHALLSEHDLFRKPVATFRHHALILLDPDYLRPSRDYTVAAHRGERLAHCVLGGRVGDQDDRHRLARAARLAGDLRPEFMALNDRFERDLLLRQPPRDGGGT